MKLKILSLKTYLINFWEIFRSFKSGTNIVNKFSIILFLLSIVFLFFGGYYLTYTLFFMQLPIDKISYDSRGGKNENFIYDGVAYFEGKRLTCGQELKLNYVVPKFVENKANKKLEIFIYADDFEKTDEIKSSIFLGDLHIFQGTNDVTIKIPLKRKKLQRFVIPWYPKCEESSSLIFLFQPYDKNNNGDKTDNIVISTLIKDTFFWGKTALFFSLTVLFFFASLHTNNYRKILPKTLIYVLLFIMYLIHSGAFISNDYFKGHRKIEGMGIQTLSLLKYGHFKENMYRGVGFSLVPLATLCLEGNKFSLEYKFSKIFPTSRYILFAWAAASLAFLYFTLIEFFGISIAFTTGFLTTIFFPFIVDLYAPDADAYFIPLMIIMTGLFIKFCFKSDYETPWMLIFTIGILLFIMVSIKIQVAFLLILLPVSKWSNSFFKNKIIIDKTAMVLFIVLIFSVILGNTFRNAFNHPNRNIGIDGEEFQSNNIWSMLWSAAGIFDSYSAHDFTVSGDLRNKRISEKTGLPIKTYLRHSKTAKENVYKPSVLNAFQERPGLFYANAYLRLYNHALRFFKYTLGFGPLFEPWLDDSPKGWVNISGKQVLEMSQERRLIRFGGMWKVSPLVFLTKLIQGEMTLMTDLFLLFLALVGIAFIPRVDISIMLYGTAASQYVFGMWMHSMTRYFNFTNIALLIGLATFLVVFIKSLKNSAKIIWVQKDNFRYKK